MYRIHIEKELDAPLEKLWRLVSDFGNLDWFPAAEKVEQEGSGPGMIRRITMPGMPGAVEEKLLELDPGEHCYVYQVLENEINIMQDYTVTARLSAIDADRTLATWDGRFSGVSADLAPEMMVGVMEETYGSMLSQLAEAANKAP